MPESCARTGCPSHFQCVAIFRVDHAVSVRVIQLSRQPGDSGVPAALDQGPSTDGYNAKRQAMCPPQTPLAFVHAFQVKVMLWTSLSASVTELCPSPRPYNPLPTRTDICVRAFIAGPILAGWSSTTNPDCFGKRESARDPARV